MYAKKMLAVDSPRDLHPRLTLPSLALTHPKSKNMGMETEGNQFLANNKPTLS